MVSYSQIHGTYCTGLKEIAVFIISYVAFAYYLLVSSVTGKPIAKPRATFLTDAYSRRMLACYVTYDPPSYRSAMMAFRLCVQRYGRLPQEPVVDRGPEFGSVYFESLLSRCFVTKYVHEMYEQMDHSALGQSPREAFEQGMLLAGPRVHRLDEALLLQQQHDFEEHPLRASIHLGPQPTRPEPESLPPG